MRETLGSSSNSADAVESLDLNMNVELPVVCVAVIYHSRKGDVFERMLDSLAAMDYPKDRIILLFIDNYSRDGAFDLCANWVRAYENQYRGVIHIRARGFVSRLRNIAMRIANEAGLDFLTFVESDVVVDRTFISRLVSAYFEQGTVKNVVSVSAVRDEGVENLDWLERRYVRWLRGRGERHHGLMEGEAFNSGNCLMDLNKSLEVGWFDEDVRFIEDLDWGRRATRKGYVCLFDSRVVIPHLKKYSLKDMRSYFMAGALSEAKLFLKNGLGLQAARRVLYWSGLFTSLLLSWVNPLPALALFLAGYVVYFRRAKGFGKVLLFPVSMPFNIVKSLGLGAAMIYWLLKGGYGQEKVTMLGEPDWEVVLWEVPVSLSRS
ncbi:MAG: glycosyltransferase [Candidatus Caldarchaeum sp.]|nr:glycosyltransferase [Candidatus Caldarchaeum sp.]